MCCSWHFPSRVVLKFDLNYYIMVSRGQDKPMIGKYFLVRYLPDLSDLLFLPARESLPLSSHKGGRVGHIGRFSQYRRNWGVNSLKRTYQNILLTDQRALRLPCRSDFNVWRFPECVSPSEFSVAPDTQLGLLWDAKEEDLFKYYEVSLTLTLGFNLLISLPTFVISTLK